MHSGHPSSSPSPSFPHPVSGEVRQAPNSGLGARPPNPPNPPEDEGGNGGGPAQASDAEGRGRPGSHPTLPALLEREKETPCGERPGSLSKGAPHPPDLEFFGLDLEGALLLGRVAMVLWESN